MEVKDLTKLEMNVEAIKDLLSRNIIESKHISDQLDSLISLSAKLVSKSKDINHSLNYVSANSLSILKNISNSQNKGDNNEQS